jgi:hypothetical protein
MFFPFQQGNFGIEASFVSRRPVSMVHGGIRRLSRCRESVNGAGVDPFLFFVVGEQFDAESAICAQSGSSNAFEWPESIQSHTEFNPLGIASREKFCLCVRNG